MTYLLCLIMVFFISGVIWMPLVGWFIGQKIVKKTVTLQNVQLNLGGIIGAIIGLVIWLVFVMPNFLNWETWSFS